MRFRDFLAEVMSVSGDDAILKDNGKGFYTQIDIHDKKYLVQFNRFVELKMRESQSARGIYSVEFFVDKSKSLVGDKLSRGSKFKMQNFDSGIEFRILPRVMGAIFSFIKKEKPALLTLACDINDRSRMSVYKKLLQKYEFSLNALGYTAKNDSGDVEPEDWSAIIDRNNLRMFLIRELENVDHVNK